MDIEIIFKDKDLLVVNKPAGLVVFPENKTKVKTLIDYLIKKHLSLKEVGAPKRYGVIHRLDKETSGVLLIAKNNKALTFFQKQFKERDVVKKYIALVIGNIKQDSGVIETLIGRSPKDRRKQKVYFPQGPNSKGKRKAETHYKIIKKFKDYTLLKVFPKTGRKHQIRTHLAYLSHPIAGDKMYGFKNQPCPKGLEKQFLHAKYLKIKMLNKKEKEFKSELPKNLKEILKNLRAND